jgi:hypothetical protein
MGRRVALLPAEWSDEKAHDIRVGVHRRKIIKVGWTPSPQEQASRAQFRRLRTD